MNTITNPKSRARPRRRRSAYVLVIVLGLAVISFAAGTAFLEAHSTVLTEAVNLQTASRARYLAESGVDIACHYLIYPPDSVAEGAFWTGGAGMSVDATSDYVSVRVQQDDTFPDVFQIDSFGFAHDTDGEVRGKRGVRARVMAPPPKWVKIPYAAQIGGSTVLGMSVTIVGDLHVQGDLIMLGDCNGDVTSTGSLTWVSFSSPASATSGVDPVTMPEPYPESYATYKIGDDTYHAIVYDDSTMDASDVVTLNALLDADDDNPGRVVLARKSKLVVEEGFTLNGTLAVTGDISFEDAGWRYIVAEADYPAIMCGGTVSVKNDDVRVGIYGTVVCERVDLNSKDDVFFGVLGALVTTADEGVDDEGGSGAEVYVQYSEPRAKYRVFGQDIPCTILQWSDY